MLFFVAARKGIVLSGDGKLVVKIGTTVAVAPLRRFGTQDFVEKNAFFLGNDVVCGRYKASER